MAACLPPDAALLAPSDWRAVLDVLGDLADALDDGDGFARCGVEVLPRLAASEITTLSLCDLARGHRHVIGRPACAIGAQARTAFDHHFHAQPLVRYHAAERGAFVHRISDSPPFADFRQTGLYDDYYRVIGIDYAVALPLRVDDEWLVSFVFNRHGRDFSEREVACLEQARVGAARLFARTSLVERARDAGRMPHDAGPQLRRVQSLTDREHEVLRWVAAGKTDRDIAAILAISHRTVHKHLQSAYAKLGVETRTAAVMRLVARTDTQSCALAARPRAPTSVVRDVHARSAL
jgi:DNA-binding CsgD family transcriptional regulator